MSTAPAIVLVVMGLFYHMGESAPSPAADPARTLSVRVVGPQGEPVPDAEVTAVRSMVLGGSTFERLGWTDSAGELRGGLKPGLLDLRIVARGYRSALWKGIQIPQDRDPEPVTVTLERGATLEVRARDEEGKPLAGVQVRIHLKVFREDWMLPRHPLVTDGDGLVRIEDLTPDEYIVGGSIPDGGECEEVNVRLGSETARADLLFERGVAIAGRVVNEHGEPVPSASVQAEAEELGYLSRSGISQADGSFVIPDLRADEYRLTASAEGQTSEPQGLRLEGSGVEGLEIRLSRQAGGAISGRVLGLSPEELSRLQIKGSTVFAWESARSPVDKQGRYRLSGLRSGRWNVSAFQADGHIVQEIVEVKAGAEVVLDLQFPEGLTFSGSVALDGRPFRGAQIFATPFESLGLLPATRVEATADSEGRFSLGPLKPGPYSILVHGAESALGTVRTVQIQEGREIRLEIETGGFQGHVLAESGEAVPDAVIQLRVVDPATGYEVPDLGPAIRSDARGAFEILSIPAGLYDVVVQKPGHEKTRLRVEIAPGALRVQDVVCKRI